MATLTETAYYTRKTIKYGTIGLVAIIFLRIILSATFSYWRKIHPSPPPPPNVAFGKLPKIEFPESKFKEEKIVFRLETVNQGTPNLGDRIKVYFMPIQKPTLLNLERAKNQAKKMGFMSEPKKITETTYQWQKEGPLSTTLTMDIINNNFVIKKNWQDDQTLLVEKMLPVKEQAMLEAKNFLRLNGLPNNDLQMDKAKLSFLRFVAPNLLPAISLSEADFVRIELFRENLDNLPILPPNPNEALVSFLFSGSKTREKRILEVNFTHFPIAYETFATYPLKTSAQAWRELKAGKGFIANLKKGKTQIIIRKIYLAYFENTSPQNYLQPIYVFEGDDNFMAYVPAISPEWTE